MALEIGIWVYDEAPRLSTQMAQPICEALVPIQSARERNTDFWPLRPPPSSPQARRKSLNDLIGKSQRISNSGPRKSHPDCGFLRPESHKRAENHSVFDGQLSAGYHQTIMPTQWSKRTHHEQPVMVNAVQNQLESKYSVGEVFVRERSASNRNLPDTSLLRTQPRRASDEVAASSSHRLSTRVSPAASRRSISVMNVGDSQPNYVRPSSRVGSIMKGQSSRESAANQSVSGSPVTKYSPPMNVGSTRSSEVQTETYTPSGRRSSLKGVQSMVGYRSQKNSQSDASDREQQTQVQQQQHHQQSTNQRTGPNMSSSSASKTSELSTPVKSSSRRGSNSDQQQPGPLQRKGSFAMLTFRKLKRTMSLTKDSEDASGAGQNNMKGSHSSSEESELNLGEDVGVTRRIASRSGKLLKP